MIWQINHPLSRQISQERFFLPRKTAPWVPRLPGLSAFAEGCPRMPAAQPTLPMYELSLPPIQFVAWRRRCDLEHRARNLTRARRDALQAILAHTDEAGELTCTDAEVAETAAVSARTVRRARADAAELGLLTWKRTRRLVNGQWRQGPNSYAINVPAGQLLCDAPVGQRGRANKERIKKERGADNRPSSFSDSEARRHAPRQAAELLGDAGPVPDLLAARVRVMQDRLIAGYAARNGRR